MFENTEPYLEILQLADRLNRMGIPFFLVPCAKEGWQLDIYQSVGVFFGKREFSFVIDRKSLDKKDWKIEVLVGEGTYSTIDDSRHFSATQDECFDMILRWYKERYDRVMQ